MDVQTIRKDFPALAGGTEKRPVIYFDNTSVTLMPEPVLASIMDYYRSPGNMRSAHEFSIETMMKCNAAREKIAKLINAESSSNIVWTKNATEGINLISKSLDIKPNEIVLTTDKEHNSNLVPWHNLRSVGVSHKIIKSKDDGTFDLAEFERLLSDDVKLVSLAHTSIIDGYTIPAKEIIKISHENRALVLLDSVLTVQNQTVDVRSLGVDFLVFTPSNMCGPNGVGVLYSKDTHLNNLRPFLSGSGANTDISYSDSDHQGPPAKFEAGGQNCAGIIGAGAAVEYLHMIGLENINKHMRSLNAHISDELSGLEKLMFTGPKDPKLRGGIFNFNIEGVNQHDIAIALEDLGGILVRSGHLCAHSWFHARKSNGVVSVSFYLYNSDEEIIKFIEVLKQMIKDFF